MAEPRPSRSGDDASRTGPRSDARSAGNGSSANGLPANGLSANGSSSNGSSDKRPVDSKFRVVNPDPFPESDLEPDDDSPTIISKLAPRSGDSRNSARDGSDLRGRRLAHFELIEPIGVGGMAAVLRARDTQLDRFVALKILPPETARDPENIRRFHQEARAAARLDHENIARVFYCGEDQGLHFIAFEFVEGDNLRKILERRGRLPTGEAVRYVLQVAIGLEHAATRGVVHRDIKPSNIIVMPDGRAKVVDMGLARSLEPHADDGLTQSGVTLGTFDYISPEQALEPREADSRSDIYSLGCTLYHMLTGHPPVPEGTAAKKLQHHQHVAPVDPRLLNPEIPDDVARVLGKMMAKNPKDRYQRPIHLVHDLTRVSQRLGDEIDAAHLHFELQPVESPRKQTWTLALIGIGALAAVLFLLSLAPNERRPNHPPRQPATARPVLVAKPPPEPVKNAAPAPTAIRTEDDLQRALDRAAESERVSIALDRDVVLTGRLKVVATPRSRPLIEVVGPDRQPARLILNVDSAPTSALAGIKIDGANIAFRNVRFEIAAAPAVKKLEVPVSAVSIAGGSIVAFEQCAFAQSGLASEIPFIYGPPGVVPAASLLVSAPVKSTGETAKVTLRDCFFPSGQAGVAVVGSAKVSARDCAFQTLGTLFHLKGGGEPAVSLEHCTGFLHNGPAFRIDGDTASRLKLDYCLFSVPDTTVRRGDNPDLLCQTDSTDTRLVLFQGQWNRYHRLNNVWVAGGPKIVIHDELQLFSQVGRSGSFDKDSLILPQDPSPFLSKFAASANNLVEAFQLRPLRDLETSRDRHDEHPMIGVRRCLDVTLPRLPPLVPEPSPVAADYKPAANEKVVDPDYAGAAVGFYDSLAKALADANPGDVITLRPGPDNTPFALKPTDLEADLTLRGFPGTLPTLTLADTRISDAALFRLLDGVLQLENLHILLEPARDGFLAQSVVSVVGGGSAILKNCTVTLRPRDRANPKAIPLSVVSAVAGEDVKMMMMTDNRPYVPTLNIALHDCFVRGDGDLVVLRSSRPANIKIARSLAFLSGALVHQLQSAAKESTNADAPIALRLKDSAFFAGDPFLWIQAGKAAVRHQNPIRVEQADHCLFAALGDRPLASIEGADSADKSLFPTFDWKGLGNAFAHFDAATLVEFFPGEDAIRPIVVDETMWRDAVERDPDARFLPAGFKSLPSRPLSLRAPEDAVIAPEANDDLQPYLSQLPKYTLPKNGS